MKWLTLMWQKYMKGAHKNHFPLIGRRTKEIFMCCGNCGAFEPKEGSTIGYCGSVYWRWDFDGSIDRQSFCLPDFRLSEDFKRRFHVKKNSRDPDKCLAARLQVMGYKQQRMGSGHYPH